MDVPVVWGGRFSEVQGAPLVSRTSHAAREGAQENSGRSWRLAEASIESSDPLDLDPHLAYDIQPIVGAIGRAVVDLRYARIHDRLGTGDARLGRHEDDLARIVRAHLDQGVNLRMNAAAGALLIGLAVIMREPFRGAVVAEPVDLGHVFRCDYAADLEPLAGRASGERHGEVHD